MVEKTEKEIPMTVVPPKKRSPLVWLVVVVFAFGLFLAAASVGAMADRMGYTTVKGALAQLTKSVAVRYAKDNIRAIILCPSTLETPLVQEMLKNPERRTERLGEVP